jgi:hypothetical protein
MAVCEKFTAFQLIERAMARYPDREGRLATSTISIRQALNC